jgi:hypothetical protein
VSGLKRIYFDDHSIMRLAQRSSEFSLDIFDARKRACETILCGNVSKTKKSRRRKVFYRYYDDNLSFFVFCIENKRRGSYEGRAS